MELRVVGLDPSLRNWGIAKGLYDVERKQLVVSELDVIQPVLPTGKQTRQSSKDLIAARQHMDAVSAAIADAQMVFVEVPVGSQSAAAMKGYGICIGLLGALQSLGTPFIELSPLEIKLAATGRKTASKQEMIDWGCQHYPTAPWPTQTVKGELRIINGKAEHMADAVAAIHAGLSNADFQRLLTLIA